MNIDQMVQEWHNAQINLKGWKEQEDKLRMVLAEDAFGFDDTQLQKGTKKHPLSGGMEVRCKFDISIKVQKENVNHCLQQLREANVPEELISQVFRYKPELDVKVFKMLSKPAQEIVECILVKKPSKPSIELKSLT